MERATGIEPAFTAWEAVVLPMNYARGSNYNSMPHSSSNSQELCFSIAEG